MTLHRCIETDCPYLGQPSISSCRCRKSDEQVLRERNAELVEALTLACEEITHLRKYANSHGGMIDCEEFTEGLAALSKVEAQQS